MHQIPEYKKTVIIIEDDAAILDALQIVCARAGYTVVPYLNGYRLLKDDWEVPDIFLIDRQLSGIDGLDLCKHLKNQAATKHIPVIILSASPHLQLPAKEAGAESFLEKPFSNKVLLAEMERLTEPGQT